MQKYLLIILFQFVITGLFAQAGGKVDTKDAISAERVAFITKKMSLTSDEAEKLWPIFNEFEQKKDNVRAEKVKARKKFDANKNLSEKEIEEIIDTEAESHKKDADLFMERHRRLKKIFTAKRVAELYKAEEEFKKWLIEHVKTSKQKD